MAAPSHTARIDPSSLGIPLFTGHSTKITIAADPNIEFWEKTVTPPGMDGGDPIDITTMFNSVWETFVPRELVTLTECSLTVSYDPICYTQILAVINVATTITVMFPDGSQVSFYGYLRTFEPQEHERGSQPEANITIQPTNYDSANDVEAGPLVTEVAGT